MHDRYVRSLLSSIESRLRGSFGGGYDEPRRGDDIERALVNIRNQQLAFARNLEAMMATLQEALDRVKSSGDRLDSLIEYNKGIKEQLDAVLAGVLTAEQQAQVDAIFAEADENVAKTDAALNTNVPPATPVDTQ